MVFCSQCHILLVLIGFVLSIIIPVWAVDPLVKLDTMQVQGITSTNGITSWLGVPYASPPVGKLRFAAPIDPPSNPDTVIDCTKLRPICLPNSPDDFTMKPNKRFTVSEDCLYLNIFAPSNATPCKPLPVMYFIQGGGFGSNSNANFNGGDLAAFGNMIVVQVNYRVGPFGFAHSKEITSTASTNNGLRDILQGNKWLKQNIQKFGGNPDQIVIQGDSAGATAIALLLAGLGDKTKVNEANLFKGAILESPSVATVRTLEQGQEQFDCLTKAAGCDKDQDPVACLRGLDASKLQTPNCQFNPNIDNDLIKQQSLTSFDKGEFLRIPTIIGWCQDEGTKSVDSSVNTLDAALKVVNDAAFGALSDNSLQLIKQTYMVKSQPVFKGQGALWRQTANAHRDYRVACIIQRFQNALANANVPTFSYVYAVQDQEQDELGFGAFHTVELNAVFGPNNTDGNPPKSYTDANAGIVPVTMAYWASFVRNLDPNTDRKAGTPQWDPWTGTKGRNRLRFVTNKLTMETMPDFQIANCEMLDPMLPAIETPTTPKSVDLKPVAGTDDPPGPNAVPSIAK